MTATRTFSAKLLYTLEGSPIQNGAVTLDGEGTVLEIGQTDQPQHDGIICPGFINAHCHLELSHMKGRIPDGTGLPKFLRMVTENRAFQEEAITKAAKRADQEMKANGIVACGDISNTLHTLATKQQSPIRYHTFVERFGANPAMAKEITKEGIEMTNEYRKAHQSASLNLHATYSISRQLSTEITEWEGNAGSPRTIHMQEHPDEDLLYQNASGAFFEFLQKIGANSGNDLWPSGKTALRTLWPLIASEDKMLLVHNTNTSPAEIQELHNTNAHWCLCPNANRYIESRTPELEKFAKVKDRLMLGTDSLASNWQLSILAEMKELRSQTNTENLLKMACANPARFFGWDELGTIAPGKRPGLNLLQGLDRQQNITKETTVTPLI